MIESRSYSGSESRRLSSWDKDGMSLPKYIIPKISSSRSGSFFLSERVLEHILLPEEGSIH